MKVIAITGTNGAGKGTAAQLLREKFPQIQYRNTRDIIYAIAEQEGVKITNREELTNFANDYNAVRGNSFFKTFIEQHKNEDVLYIFESVRRIHEVKTMREILAEDFVLLAVDASPKLRYERISEGRKDSVTDNVTFEEFKKQELMEQNTDDDRKQNLSGCVQIADFVIDNQGSMEDFNKQINLFIEKYPNFFQQA